MGEIFLQRFYEVFNVYTKIDKKESTSLVQTGFDKTRNCGENRDWKIEADSCPHDFNLYTESKLNAEQKRHWSRALLTCT